ncbi:methyl-accepting chemotaxis protein [Stakelama sp. CBK3Z-3]|uniref:Methyl-accepting chemotaxis protein n=1 Tax=Stakelama flava TaxID=2860338 RepID=A0ABS6XLM9_9SPHN|nr:methyl-accepting chemotaxis protein [Stakelama flava]MBW4330330.1 methyl-accepting chemotaxis protein [Stakelama flava]
MDWFTTKAPIRQKLHIVVWTMVGLVGAGVLVAAFLPLYLGLPIGGAVTIAAWYQGMRFREAITGPYVTTVQRMEALAAGDLDSPIAFTDYEDCVGRMTKAMFTFRETEAKQRRSVEEQAAVVREFSAQLERVADGDLTAEVTADLTGDYAVLKDNFNHALVNLRELLGQVQGTVSAIRTGSHEIAQASEDLARRTEANAASLEETSAAVTEMNDRLRMISQAAGRTVERADGAIGTVNGGRETAGDAVQAMERVSESAKGIDDVIEGLDKIAFQTRVLAMNAAVEAGRAGEAGRGFAVVADLVSALAMRAEEEAGRAREQLTATQTDIVAAVDMVHRVDGALNNISSDVSEVHTLLEGMAKDNQAQAGAINEITTAVNAMDQSTQQNAAMVEETSAAARNLANEVSQLGNQAQRFRIDANTRSAQGFAQAKPGRAPVATMPPSGSAAASRGKVTSGEWASF